MILWIAEMVGPRGVIAAGHPETSRAAQLILEAGGNAYDAVVAAHLTACVAEPVLASLGGGGFLLAHPSGQAPVLYDFFTQTPLTPPDPEAAGFYPIHADFGTATQEFHIGMGSIATPGCIRGLFRIHRNLCTLPMAELATPAITLARRGVRVNGLQAYITSIISPILRSGSAISALFSSTETPGRLLGEGELQRMPELADTIEHLCRDGPRLFYAGELGRRLVAGCEAEGGHLSMQDLRRYRVQLRRPLRLRYRDMTLLLNPPPSCGGVLIAYSLTLLGAVELGGLGFGSLEHLRALAHAMQLTGEARAEAAARRTEAGGAGCAGLSPATLRRHLGRIHSHPRRTRGTTQISVIDGVGNLASMTVSNGEGSGYIIPGTGIILNNMLGEEDLNTQGFHRWPPNRRLSSMMAPTLVWTADGRALALGSGGSNRIRTALLQVLSNLADFRMSVRQAIHAPRIHLEHGLLSVEPGIAAETLHSLQSHYPRIQQWQSANLFFGGVHTACADSTHRRFEGVGDPRRGGVAIVVPNPNQADP